MQRGRDVSEMPSYNTALLHWSSQHVPTLPPLYNLARSRWFGLYKLKIYFYSKPSKPNMHPTELLFLYSNDKFVLWYLILKRKEKKRTEPTESCCTWMLRWMSGTSSHRSAPGASHWCPNISVSPVRPFPPIPPDSLFRSRTLIFHQVFGWERKTEK